MKKLSAKNSPANSATAHNISARLSKKHLFLLEKGDFGCSDLERLIGDYLDRELPAALCSRVSEHICSCERCEQFAGSYQFIIELAREMGADRFDPQVNPAPLADLPSSEMPTPSGVRSRLFAHLNAKLGLELADS